MTYKILISSIAEAEIDQLFLSVSQRVSPEKAKAWQEGLLKAIIVISTKGETLGNAIRPNNLI